MENEKPDMPQKKPKVNLSKENRDTDISKISPSVSSTELLEENMVEDLITNVSTGKEKNILSVFGGLFTGIYGGISLLISSILTFFSDLFYSIFAFLKVDISQLDDIKSAILIRRKMLLSLLEGCLFVGFLTLYCLKLNGNIALSLSAYCVLFAVFLVMHFSFSLLICNISNAGSDLFNRFNRSDFVAEFAYVKSIWSHQLWFFMILTLVIGPLFLVLETEFAKNLLQKFTIAPILIQGFKIWSCYLLILSSTIIPFPCSTALGDFLLCMFPLAKSKNLLSPGISAGEDPRFSLAS